MNRAVAGLVIALAAAACAFAMWCWVWQPMQCNIATTSLTRRTAAVEQSANEYERVLRARRNLEDLRAIPCTTDVRVPMLIGNNEATLGDFEAALAAYHDALGIDRRPEIYAAIGEASIRLGRTDDAVNNYVEAARFTPYVLESIPSEEVLRRVRERL